ncbi:MAG TPA: hypothetical protein VFS67_17700 [Polyangiaceae bacterium]|nr:hypothetical protein [Polyangiaceae bacterium]
MRKVTAWMFVVLSAAGCGGNDDNVESQTERLQKATVCITSEICPYGHCSTEDGTCNLPPNCSTNCGATCYGVCVAEPSPN